MLLSRGRHGSGLPSPLSSPLPPWLPSPPPSSTMRSPILVLGRGINNGNIGYWTRRRSEYQNKFGTLSFPCTEVDMYFLPFRMKIVICLAWECGECWEWLELIGATETDMTYSQLKFTFGGQWHEFSEYVVFNTFYWKKARECGRTSCTYVILQKNWVSTSRFQDFRISGSLTRNRMLQRKINQLF